MAHKQQWQSIIVVLCVSMTLVLIPSCIAKPTKEQTKLPQLDAKEIVSRQLLALMGLKDVPKPPSHGKIPQYMMDLYKIKTASSLNGNSNQGQSTTNRFSSHSKLRGNTIRSYFDQAGKKNQFKFNISDVDDKEELISAELRVYRLRHYVQLPQGHHGYYSAKVFQIMPSGIKDRLIDSQIIGHRSHGWKVFSVAPAIRYWIKYPKHNFGLKVVMTELNTHQPLHSELYQFAKHPPHHRSKQALLIISSNVQLPKLANLESVMKTVEGDNLHYKSSASQTNDQNDLQKDNEHPSRQKRSVNKRRGGNDRNYQPQDYSNSPCHREDLIVDFKDIGWDWIISPRSFNAYQCVGVCKYPLGSSTNATLHATLRAMMSYFGRNSKPTLPCCTPDRLSSHTFLFYNANHEIQINEFEGMSVNTCGCH